MPVVLLSKLNLVITGKQVRLFNLASSLLRQHKILTANSGFAQFLPYSRNSISDYRFIPNQICNRAKTMAVSGSKAIFGDVYADELVASCGNGLDFLKPSGVYFADRSHSSCQKASVILRKQEQPNNRFLCGYYICDAMLRNTKYNPPFGPRMKVSVICFFGVDFRAIPAIGVADGVGGWAEVGINAGEFARELMSNSVAAIQDEPKGFIDPARVLEKAHSSTKSQGSSTACIIALTEEGIHAINLGDSGFIVVRDGCTVFHSPVQQHGFNFTYQLESGDNGDLPSSGQVFRIPVLPGDVIVAGTDGLFDNLYNNEVTAVVVHALRAGFSPELMAKQIAALARERAVNRNRQTPFAKAAQDAGFRYYGGKLDDITVVVSYITSSANV
ncbi:probable protein phosphatase 2C 55 isoform X5 [Durio zibethinus]|uniref:Protein phosphatase n=1 Tax=Durio zibethinus TaxID=66656 RepID=A0A6P5YH42_DURZI|nr:probable protein phosphatase 2C 55 isoform X5 [Durio zibethinus]